MPVEMNPLTVQIQRPDGSWVDVGRLSTKSNRNWFEFDPAYWELAARPVLGQTFEEHGSSWRPNAHVSLPRWFSHLLPEGTMRAEVARVADINPVREFELLRLLGPTDLQGAVRALPASLVSEELSVPAESNNDHSKVEDPLLKFSLAGVQLKYSVFKDEAGLTVPAHGTAGNVIAKLPDLRPGFQGVPEAEYAALELARRVGIKTATATLVRISDIVGLEEWVPWVGEKAVLAVDRFDRRGRNQRVHMEEFAQVMNVSTFPSDAKYRSSNFEMIADLAGALSGLESVVEVIDRIILNVMIGNGDAHVKNWAFLYSDGQNPDLSPVYDIVPTVLYMPGDDMGLNLNKSKQFESVTIDSFDGVGKRTGLGVSEARQRAASAVARILDHWDVLRDGLIPSQFAFLSARLDSLPLVRQTNTN